MKKGALILTVAVVVIVVVSLFIALFVLNVPPRPQMQLDDPSGDVLLSLGSGYPGVVDITGASFERSGNSGNFSILAKEGTTALNQGQTVTWEVTLIFENSTDDVVSLHTLLVVLNSTGYSGSITNVETNQTTDCAVNSSENLISAVINFVDLADADKVEWSITSSYEAEEGDELVANAFDFAPDEGIYTTTFGS